MVSGNFRYERPNGSPRININPEASQPLDLFEPQRTLEDPDLAFKVREILMPDDDVMPDMTQTDMGNDPCCGEAKEMWREGLVEGWGDSTYTNDPDGGLRILEMYEAMSCEEFRQSLENRFDAEGYAFMYGRRSLTRPGMNPNSPRSNHSWEDSLANRVLEAWDKCSEASLPTDQASQDMGFYASSDAFEITWDMLQKGDI